MNRATTIAFCFSSLLASLLGCGGGAEPTGGMGGAPATSSTTADTSSSTGGGCLGPSDCPGSDDECQARTCSAGACGVAFTAADTPVAAQTANNCLKAVCDGNGNVGSLADDADLPIPPRYVRRRPKR